MQWCPHLQMRILRPLLMSDPGQFQTTQAAAQNKTQDLVWTISLHHGNHPGTLKDKTWWSILLDIKDGPGNAVNEAHMKIIWGSCVKVERTIHYIQMLLMNWSKIWKKEIQHGIRLWVAIMKVQWQGHSLLKKTVVEIAKFDIWNRKCLIKYSLIYFFI